MNNIAAIIRLVCLLGLVTTTIADDNDFHLSNKVGWNNICALTDYKDACEKSIANAKDERPNELFKELIHYTADAIGHVIRNSSFFRQAATDQSTKSALDVCDIVLDRAIEDLELTCSHIGEESHVNAIEVVDDLKTWLSAVITYQETCIDAFDKMQTGTGQKMKELLTHTKKLSSNALAIACNTASILSSFNVGGSGSSRKLFSVERRELLFNSQPNAVVALDGSGQFKSINEAINAVPNGNRAPYLIKIKAGLYKEQVNIPKGKNLIMFLGEGPFMTRITGNKNFEAGVKTFQSCTVAVNADDFMAKDLAIENTAGPKGHQAVALRVSGDHAIFHNVNIDGYQDTLYTHVYRQFYRWCRICGTIDFIFGDSLAVFQKCDFIVRKPSPNQACMVTAQGRLDPRSQGAIIIQNGHFMATKQFHQTQPPVNAYLGRPWKELSRTIIMQSYIDGFFRPEGWSPWSGNFALDTLYYAEYNNRGPGANQVGRVKWKGIHQLTAQQAESFTPGTVYGGDEWIRGSGIPYESGMMRV